jgi:hypothetical protein
VKRLLAVLALALYASIALGDEPNLVDAARRATAYWSSLFARCGDAQGQSVAWYAVDGITNSIQMVRELDINFKTDEISKEERLNGVEFKAVTSLASGAFRWWIAKDKAWREWQVGEIAPSAILIKKNGVWVQNVVPDRYESRKALTTCAQVLPALTH